MYASVDVCSHETLIALFSNGHDMRDVLKHVNGCKKKQDTLFREKVLK